VIAFGSEIMLERRGVARTPRERFARAAQDELERFVREKIVFQKVEREAPIA
jgi:hypothetical protein